MVTPLKTDTLIVSRRDPETRRPQPRRRLELRPTHLSPRLRRRRDARTTGGCAMVTPLKTDTLIVSRRDPETRRHSRVGFLSYDQHIFRFDYDDGVTRALPGLP